MTMEEYEIIKARINPNRKNPHNKMVGLEVISGTLTPENPKRASCEIELHFRRPTESLEEIAAIYAVSTHPDYEHSKGGVTDKKNEKWRLKRSTYTHSCKDKGEGRYELFLETPQGFNHLSGEIDSTTYHLELETKPL